MALLLFLGSLLLVALVPPAGWGALPDLCLFHRVTGLACPTCGLTRSWAALLRGEVLAAQQFHAFGAVSLLLLAGTLGFRQFAGRWPRLPRAVVGAGMLLWTGYGLGRMLGVFLAP